MILALDPGPAETGYALIDPETCRPLGVGKAPNGAVGELIWQCDADTLAIEMVASYGMPVGADVFETCVWIGRFYQHSISRTSYKARHLIKRRDVKLHHCYSANAKDANITRALIDRFAPGAPNHGKGTKAAPGWFYGFRADIWQAYALAVYVADTRELAA